MSKRDPTIFNARDKKSLRTKLRNSATPAEAVLWTYLKGRQILNRKFRRQASIGRYVVDFYCPECKLIIELDGAQHFGQIVGVYDELRNTYLESLGLRIIRFENRAIFDSLDFVLEHIRFYLNDLHS